MAEKIFLAFYFLIILPLAFAFWGLVTMLVWNFLASIIGFTQINFFGGIIVAIIIMALRGRVIN
jgi:hypothetical protein